MTTTASRANEEQDNDLILAALAGLIATHNAALPLSFSPDPLIGIPAEGVTYSTNLSLKTFPPILEAPADRELAPNTADQCRRRITLNQTRADFADYLGFIKFETIPEDWSSFGTPFLAHTNSDVELILKNPRYIESDPDFVCANSADPNDDCHKFLPQSFELPAGRHNFVWEANTQLNPFIDIVLPPLMLSFHNEYKHGKAALDAANSSAEELAKRQRKSLEKLIDWAREDPTVRGLIDEALIVAADRGLPFPQITSATHRRTQSITVFDVLPPTISVPQLVELEATDIGGVTYERVREQLRAAVTATDECDRIPAFGIDQPPALFTLGDNPVTWSATDAGPLQNPIPGGPSGNRVTANQIVRVVDTQAPIILPPSGRVVEVNGASSIASSEVQLGAPRVVDLADASPSVSNDGPASYPVNSRSEIIWSATDAAGNTATATQLLTVKPSGTNNPPTALNVSASTLTSQPVDLVLRGTDPDLIDDRFDPLNFRITEPPALGEFVAPLYPFFIEDLRVPANDVYGDPFRLASPRTAWMRDNVCNGPLDLRVDWIYQPEFVQVTDAGEYFVLDRYWQCSGAGNASTKRRLSKWSRDGEYLSQVDYEGTDEQFRWEPANFVDTVRTSRDGSSRNQLTLYRCDSDLANPCRDLWVFGESNTPGLRERTIKYVLIDDARGIAFVSDQNRIFAYDVRGDEPQSRVFPPFLAALSGSDGELDVLSESAGNCTGNAGNSGYTLDVDSAGNLYALEACGDRVHKFAPSSFDAAGNFVPGAHVGWMGRCDTSTNNACNDERGASKGFSCTNSTCSVAQLSGDAPGQFDTPTHLAIDPNDVLYIADRENNRVQRFAADGTFAGVANSTGSGINQGTEPGFVLGNMGKPHAVSVNSSQFFVLDQVEQFLHVFETSPLKDITDDSATVTYISNTDTHSVTDSFNYIASDGLASSPQATASITVNRNYRAPNALAEDLTLLEDTSVEFTLQGSDPDGIAGVDFNGLDTLSFRIVEGPRFGTLSSPEGSPTRTYTPNPEFSGTDRLLFVSNDGRDDSRPAEVLFNVVEVNDLPRILQVGFDQRIGRGFPATLTGTFFDDGEIRYRTLASWGDGVQESNGRIVGEGENARVEGVVVDAPFAPSTTGRTTAQHTYETAGSKNLQFCLWNDDTQGGCEDFSIVVEDLVALDISVESPAVAMPQGTPIDFAVTISNLQPATGPGLRANALVVTQPDDEFAAIGIVDAPLGCTIVNEALNCLLPGLDAGDSLSFTLRGEFRGSPLFDEEAALTLDLRSATPALNDSVRGIQVLTLRADATDNDNDGMPDAWENAFGLTVGSNDSAGDGDADGLSNLDEYRNRTNPANGDSDNDGLDDGLEVATGSDPNVTADSDGDGMANDVDVDDDNDGLPDAVELAAGLSPFDATDALSDLDGDGSNNLAEFQAGTNPGDPSSTPPGNTASTDLFASVLPHSRSVVIGQTATAFATLINDSADAATECRFAPRDATNAEFAYRRTDALTNVAIGELNPSVTIEPKGGQSFVFALTPLAELDQHLGLQFVCAGRNPAASFPEINGFRLQGTATPMADMIATAATVTGGGIVELRNGVGAFAIASFNVGVGASLRARPRSNTDVALTLCQTNTTTGQCLNNAEPTPEVELFINSGEAPSFAVFVGERSSVPFNPVTNRIALEFLDAGDVVRGGTSVAVRSAE